jgi:endonuclease I
MKLILHKLIILIRLISYQNYMFINILYNYLYLSNMFFLFNSINSSLLRNINSKALRLDIYDKVNKNYKYIPYEKTKEIFNEKLNLIDIYGDNKLVKNLEHIVPQSYFKNETNKKYMKSDFHNLYLCNKKLNSYRQNFKYIDPSDLKEDFISINDKILDTKGNKIDYNNKKNIFNKNGYLMISNKKSKTFIPSEYSKGKIARSLAYFSIKYNFTEKLSDIINPITLIKWNFNDPVDNNEYLKNIITYRYQNNINPFIINSDLVLYSLLDILDLEKNEQEINDIFNNRKIKMIDPILSIDYLIKEINN